MTLLIERPANHKATHSATRRDSYVTLPGNVDVPRPAEGNYVTVPGAATGSGNKAQGSYVTLHSAPMGETEISYTRVG
ncbi:hypothetical protein [Pseudarthrobacter sp. NamE5]|uniref:hypothetical protein n=1 Tax=Pseudarthrobacter sp. NamE5 TaxID=2576839 RepID=UPI00110C1472|nr:hypothetical protein [Pseudarthrobacter sp. NamE5]TLM83053.1 hypothetical protein FDW84_14610 [Pseudarthrobacter sp. NamE5]